MMVGFQERIEGIVDDMRIALTETGGSEQRSLRGGLDAEKSLHEPEKVTVNELDT